MRRVDYMLGGEDFKKMSAAHFMQTDVYYYPKNATGDKLATAITMGGFGSVPIVDKGKRLVGIISEFDLLKAITSGKELEKVTAEEIMTVSPICVTEETLSEEIIQLLQEKHLIRVPVVDKNGTLVGVVARRDILQGYLKSKESPPPWWF
ncbi:MAG: CBS domain-containing protein [Candidatus Manganitrophus sp.]|uniref:CBS domain-containing protein n=1 Tax=Candidatus Manganitrophus noduliformans TaxID=2606439 RepID=A0A7X6DM99_9BACT|nr:CBS domain-containing protein [Candidatus Manganitrophus noduliformans]MCG3111868.1 CBS domain-containing protein [Candidatus Manganitrophus morganii]MDC4202950.1 CBS domain-containing protein [Candidatus Manganitrophus sp.]MDC4223073.1 CBS domain-containing protein [Candidatus Manganitrophus sp.]NKE69694.1 CBS domain-containing protein [Candidatus Manganitrophus noduliformans]WDT69970.1 MAG: CBS domain-containing protein [Candidatus Manganitrophus sp.]